MKRLQEGFPSLILGRPWSNRFPWRIHGALDEWAAAGLYRAVDPPSFRIRQGEGRANLLFAGDLALHRWEATASVDGSFSGVRDVFSASDFRMLNLESVFTAGEQAQGKLGVFLKGDPKGVEVLKYLGVDAVTAANNHSLDYGGSGLRDSGTVLRESGISWTGIEEDREGAEAEEDERTSGVPGALVRDVQGVSVGFLAATDHFGGIPTPGKPAPVWMDRRLLEKGLGVLRSRCDIVVIHLHWGYEHVMYPLRWHRDLARSLVDRGADIVCCNHAHVPMGVESWGNGIIAHGLGNFFFGPSRKGHPLGRFGVLLRVSVDARGPVAGDVVTVSTNAQGMVRVEEKACPGFQRLCRRVTDEAFLGRVEAGRVFHELAQIHSGLGALIRAADGEGLLERQAFLRAPRQGWLLDEAGKAGPPWCEIGTWLRAFEALPEERVFRLEIPPLPQVPDLQRWLDSRLLPGRLP